MLYQSPNDVKQMVYSACTTKDTRQNWCATFCLEGFAVFVVNGDGLALSIPGKQRVCEKKTRSSTQIMELYTEK